MSLKSGHQKCMANEFVLGHKLQSSKRFLKKLGHVIEKHSLDGNGTWDVDETGILPPRLLTMQLHATVFSKLIRRGGGFLVSVAVNAFSHSPCKRYKGRFLCNGPPGNIECNGSGWMQDEDFLKRFCQAYKCQS